MEGNFSLADVAAAMGNNGDFGGANGMWFLALLILFGGGFGGMNWNRNGYGINDAANQEILFNQHFNNLDNKIDRIGNGIADATFALNNSIKDGNAMVAGRVVDEGRAIQAQLAHGIAELKETTISQTQKIMDGQAQDTIRDLQNQVNKLELQNAMCGVVRYPNGMAFNAGTSPFCGCNTCCN